MHNTTKSMLLGLKQQWLEDQLMHLVKLYPCWPQFLFPSLPLQLSLAILDKFNNINIF